MALQNIQRQYLLLHTNNLQQLFTYQQILSAWRLIPTPPEITEGCGQSLKLDISKEQFCQLREISIKPNSSEQIIQILNEISGVNIYQIQKAKKNVSATLFFVFSKQGSREVWPLKI